jgi:hypothetical protein
MALVQGKSEGLKARLLDMPWLQRVWGAFRQRQLHCEYEARREYYQRVASERGLTYRETDVIAAIRARLAKRGYSPTLREVGGVHTYAFIPRVAWHSALYDDLSELGPVTEFDYGAYGYRYEEFQRCDRVAERRRSEMNDLALSALCEAHAKRPVDWVFVYANGLEVKTELLQTITHKLGIPLVNMCLDDKQSWAGPTLGGQRVGQVNIAAAFDLSWTSARVACEWYLAEGARPIYMPEGFDMATYRPMPVNQDIPVSFIGGAYGFRPSTVLYLKKRGIPLQTFGPGWGTQSIWGDEQVKVINRSVINLGMGGIGYSESLTNVKTRDFEIPGVGGGVYLTSFNPDLAQHFVIGQEMLCYRNRDEMLELIRYYLNRPEESRAIARRGRERCLREHRWLHRYQQVCRILGVLADSHAAQGTP